MKTSGNIIAAIFASIAMEAYSAEYFVNTTDDIDDGTCDAVSCSLREALNASNALPGQDRIDFGDILSPFSTSPTTVTLHSSLPIITDSVLIDGSIVETRTLPGRPTRRPGIELDLSLAAPAFSPLGFPLYPNGLTVHGPAASGSILRGLIINGINRHPPLPPPIDGIETCFFPAINPDANDPEIPALQYCSHAISIFGADRVKVVGNYLNLDTEGESINGDGVIGIALLDTNDTVIGGKSVNNRNVMSSSDNQVGYSNQQFNMIQPWAQGWASAAFGSPKTFNNNRIIGNYLGLTASGNALNPVARGIYLILRNTPDLPDPAGGFVREGWGPQCDMTSAQPCEMVGTVIGGNTLTNIGGRSTFAMFGGQRETVVRNNTTYNNYVGPLQVQGSIEFFSNSTGTPRNAVIKGNRLGMDKNGNRSATPSRFGLTVGVGTKLTIKDNTIAGSLFMGVWIIDNSAGGLETSENVSLRRNSIIDTCLSGIADCMGIELVGPDFGRTVNDYLDPDSGANHLQNYPLLERIQPSTANGKAKIVGELSSSPNQVYLIEFFSSTNLNPSGESEGHQFIGDKTVATNSNGYASFSFKYQDKGNKNLATKDGVTFISATATRKHCEPRDPGCKYGSTSEFSLSCEWQVESGEVVNCH